MAGACKVGKLLGGTHQLGKLDRGLLRGWCDTGEDVHGRPVPASTMAQALAREAVAREVPALRVSGTTLKDHRGRRCVCFRDDVEAGA